MEAPTLETKRKRGLEDDHPKGHATKRQTLQNHSRNEDVGEWFHEEAWKKSQKETTKLKAKVAKLEKTFEEAKAPNNDWVVSLTLSSVPLLSSLQDTG